MEHGSKLLTLPTKDFFNRTIDWFLPLLIPESRQPPQRMIVMTLFPLFLKVVPADIL
jgi:hypothetical protein